MEINWLLAAVLTLFALLMINGYRKGFLKMVVSFLGTIVIIIATVFISPRISSYMVNHTQIYENTREKIENVLVDKLSGDTPRDISDLNVPDILKNDYISKNTSNMYQAIVAVMIRDYISVYAARLIVNAAAFVGTYIALSICIWLIVRSTEIIDRIPVIHGVNRLFGTAVGGAIALILVWIVFFIIIAFLGNDTGEKLLVAVQDSAILTYLFNHNLLFTFIS